MFQRLGLRYVLFVEKGGLRGLLTKKDIWFVLNGAEKDGQDNEIIPREILRQEGSVGEDLGLLAEEDADEE
jgi:chloride channel 3/4/5